MSVDRKTLALGACLSLALVTWNLMALPPGIELDGRDVLITRQAPEGRASLAAGEASAMTFSASLDERQAAKFYALRVDGGVPEGGWDITINGRRLDIDPLHTAEGLWYQIAPMYLRAGENLFEVADPTGQPLSVTGLDGFSLENSAEEAHFAAVFAGPVVLSEPSPEPLRSQYDMQHCDLVITLNMGAATIPTATLTLTGQSVVASLSTCALDFDSNGAQMVIDSITPGAGTPSLSYSWTSPHLYINFSSPISSGNNFTVVITYHGTPRPSGAFGPPYARSAHSGTPVIYTFSEPYGARQWWPCKDIPEDKFTMDTHVRCPTAYSVVSNGDLISTVNNGDGTHTYNWSEGHPLATYLVSICCTNYQAASGTYTALDGVTTMSVAHHLYPENYASESPELPRTIEVIEFFAQTFGEFPFLDEKYWTATHNSGSGMEHQTATSMPGGNLATPYHRRNIHELSHSWFGDLITCRNFDHVWIQESWATYCEALFYEHKWGPAELHQYVNAWATLDSYPIISGNGDAFSNSIVYRKGAWVLHMLRHILGDTAFFQGTRDYVADPALRYGTAVTDDMQAHFDAAAGQDLSWFFDEWLLRSTRPSYQWWWTQHQSGPDNILDVTINQIQGGAPYEMPIDLLVEYEGLPSEILTVTDDQTNQTFALNVGPKAPIDVIFDPGNWILDNVTELGAPTTTPTLLSVVGDGAAGTATVTWAPYTTSGHVGFRLYQSPNGTDLWVRIRDEAQLGTGATSALVSGLAASQTAYFRVTAVNNSASSNESLPSDVYGARLGAGAASALVVDGYDRWNGQTALSLGRNQNFAAIHGQAISAYGTPFDTFANEAVGSATLGSYDIVIWICGDESSADETFSSTEQSRVEAFLEGGGKLFVSGNEIAWDLEGRGGETTADRNFLHNYLRAAYARDDSLDYTTEGAGGSSIFGTRAQAFGTGADSPYFPDTPDVITPSGVGTDTAMDYDTSVVAGVQYAGTFGSSATPGKVVYLSFAFETISPESARNSVMHDVLSWFNATVPAGVVYFGE
jgi:aminopeptidase N